MTTTTREGEKIHLGTTPVSDLDDHALAAERAALAHVSWNWTDAESARHADVLREQQARLEARNVRCTSCDALLWPNRAGGWTSGDPSTGASTTCPGTALLHQAGPEGRDLLHALEQDPQSCSHCLRTVGARVGRPYTTSRTDETHVFHRCTDEAECHEHRLSTELGACPGHHGTGLVGSCALCGGPRDRSGA